VDEIFVVVVRILLRTRRTSRGTQRRKREQDGCLAGASSWS